MFYGGEYRIDLEKREYWFGLYKLTATRKGKTKWYDGSPSTYRNWAGGEPNQATTCIRYTKDGFKDMTCTVSFYFTCKKPAGNLLPVYVN